MLVKLSDLFDIIKPKTTILNLFKQDKEGVNFVGSGSSNNGVSSKVKDINEVHKFKKGAITVPLKGTVLHAFLQLEDFYVAHQIAVLLSKEKMTNLEKIYYCLCIRHNKFRFNYNRQADRTLSDLLIPSKDDIPDWVYEPEVISGKFKNNIILQKELVKIFDEE